MIYTIVKGNTVLFSGIYEPNLMNFKGMNAVYTVKNKDGELLLSREV